MFSINWFLKWDERSIEIITIVCAMVICAMDFLPEILSKIIPNAIIINPKQISCYHPGFCFIKNKRASKRFLNVSWGTQASIKCSWLIELRLGFWIDTRERILVYVFLRLKAETVQLIMIIGCNKITHLGAICWINYKMEWN